MGTVYDRGTKDNPNLYVGYPQAKRYVQEIESRLARGQVGIEAHTDAPTFQVLFDAFLEGLTNRNAARTIAAAVAAISCRRSAESRSQA